MVTFYRRLPRFDYVKPGSLDEALHLLAKGNNGTYRVYAGGTDLIPRLKGRIIHPPEALVDLKGIPDLDYIQYNDGEGLRIGALATIRSVVTSPVVREKFPILSQAAGKIASTQVQNRGTIAGNICSAVPSADSAPALLCLEADLLCASEKGERRIGMEAFFKGPMETELKPDELLKEIRIPPVSENSVGKYIKLSTRARMDLAVVGVAVLVTSDKERIQEIKIGLGAVAPTPIRAIEAERILSRQKVTKELIERAALKASEESMPVDDHRASAEYRKMMVEVLVKRGIHQCLKGKRR
jgi:CO/xanthine dehydrogenase FAD-binding subunit